MKEINWALGYNASSSALRLRVLGIFLRVKGCSSRLRALFFAWGIEKNRI